MGAKDLMTLNGGGVEVRLSADDHNKLLELHVEIDDYRRDLEKPITGWMHVDLADAKDLYDTLGLWLRENRVI